MTPSEALARLDWLIADAGHLGSHFHQWTDEDRRLLNYLKEMMSRGQKVPQSAQPQGKPENPRPEKVAGRIQEGTH